MIAIPLLKSPPQQFPIHIHSNVQFPNFTIKPEKCPNPEQSLTFKRDHGRLPLLLRITIPSIPLDGHSRKDELLIEHSRNDCESDRIAAAPNAAERQNGHAETESEEKDAIDPPFFVDSQRRNWESRTERSPNDRIAPPETSMDLRFSKRQELIEIGSNGDFRNRSGLERV
jgi:hypothetical protein